MLYQWRHRLYPLHLATEGLLEEARKRGAFATHRRGAGAIWARLSTSLEQLIQKIASTPEPYLRERREVKVQPVANVMAAGVLKTVTAPMPLIVLQDKDVQLKLLRNFDASEQRKTRSDKAASEILGTFGGVTIESFPG